jgi:hypothetical protein
MGFQRHERTDWTTAESWLVSRQGRLYFSPKRPQRLWGQIIWRVSGMKRLRSETDHTAPFSAQVKG